MSAGLFFLGTAAAVGGQILQGQAQAKSLESQAEGLELQAQASREQAQDRVEQINQRLITTIATQKAMFAARGMDVSSPTAIALSKDSERAARRDVATVQVGSSRDIQQKAVAAAARREEADTASLLGILGGGATAGRSLFGFTRLGR